MSMIREMLIVNILYKMALKPDLNWSCVMIEHFFIDVYLPQPDLPQLWLLWVSNHTQYMSVCPGLLAIFLSTPKSS